MPRKQRELTHCPNGHEYTPENLLPEGSYGDKRCRECLRVHERRRQETYKRPKGKPPKMFEGKPIDDFEFNRGVALEFCEHHVKPMDRFTEPGHWPQIGHCYACGCTVKRESIDSPWVPITADIPTEKFKEPMQMPAKEAV